MSPPASTVSPIVVMEWTRRVRILSNDRLPGHARLATRGPRKSSVACDDDAVIANLDTAKTSKRPNASRYRSTERIGTHGAGNLPPNRSLQDIAAPWARLRGRC